MKDFIVTVFPIVSLLILGVLFKRKSILSSEQIEGLKFVSMNLFLPVVLFRTFLLNDYSFSTLTYLFVLYPICLVMLLCGYLLNKKIKADRSVPFLMTGFEVGMLGYALYGFLNHDDLSALALLDFGHSIFMFSTYFVLLNMSFGKGSVSDSVLSTIRSPFFIAFASGLLLGILEIGKALETSVFMACLDSLYTIFSKALSATILISLGYGIEVRKEVLAKSILLCLARILLSVIGCLLAVHFFSLTIGMNRELLAAILVFFVLPPTYTVSAYVKEEQSMKLVSTMSSLYTILSVLAYFVIAALF